MCELMFSTITSHPASCRNCSSTHIFAAIS